MEQEVSVSFSCSKKGGKKNQILEIKNDNMNDRLQSQEKYTRKRCLIIQNPTFDASRSRM